MDAMAELATLEASDSFVARHIGPSNSDIAAMFNSKIVKVSGEEDHIHILLSSPPDFNPCRFVNSL